MPWPLSQDYNEAIQSATTNFSDAELRQGRVVMNALGLPMPRSGNFADVYEFDCPANKWAIKCFTREVAGLKERYREISTYLKQVSLPFMVDFTYLDQGIRVRGQWFPVLKMRWVEGFTLNEFVKSNLDKPQVLEILSQIWLKLASRLRDAQIAHCDLQHGNVLLVPGSKAGSLAVKLVDYDGMYVPALKLLKSVEVGHPNFQHPQRVKEGIYSLDVDRFSHLVIYTALRCLMVGGQRLWERYDNGENLLFRQRDLEAPESSTLFQELLVVPDPVVQGLVIHLMRAAKNPLDQTPLLDDVVSNPIAASRSIPQATVVPPPTTTVVPLPGVESLWATVATVVPPPSATVVPPLRMEDIHALATAQASFVEKSPSRKKSSKAMPIAVGVFAVAALFGIAILAVAGFFAFRAGINEPTKQEVAQKTTPDTLEPKPPKEEPAKQGDKGTSPPKYFTNSLGMKFAWIPPGGFVIGSPKEEISRGGDEMQHKVTLSKGFYMGVYTVTQEEWQEVMGNKPSNFKGEKNSPVERVSWVDCKEFIKKLRDREPVLYPYRLPTEAEWEYACRAGTTTPFSLGETISTDQANYQGDFIYGNGKKGVNRGKPTPVGSFSANAWGLYDMSGNVHQWCQDWYGQYPQNDVVDPQGPGKGEHRVLRGGSFNSPPHGCRSASRFYDSPGNRGFNYGFRLCFFVE